MERDPLLQERWKEKEAHEHGEEGVNSKGIDLYYSFLERGQHDASFEPLAKELERSIGDYADSVIRSSRHKGNPDQSAISAAEEHRTRMHETLMDAANRISRWYLKHGIDNKWRSVIIGLDRKRAGAWALAIAREVLGKNLEE